MFFRRNEFPKFALDSPQRTAASAFRSLAECGFPGLFLNREKVHVFQSK